jgi:hypothetical protein
MTTKDRTARRMAGPRAGAVVVLAMAGTILFSASAAQAACRLTDLNCIVQSTGQGVGSVGDQVGGAVQGVGGAVQGVGGAVQGVGGQVGGAVGGAVQGVGGTVQQVGGAVQQVGGTVQQVGDQVSGAVGGAGDTVKGVLNGGGSGSGGGGGSDPGGSGPGGSGPGGSGGPGGPAGTGGNGSPVATPAVVAHQNAPGGVIPAGPSVGHVGTVASQATPKGFLRRVGLVVSSAAGALGFPLALAAFAIAFVAVQNRLDRKDPKLAEAPIEPDVVRFN